MPLDSARRVIVVNKRAKKRSGRPAQRKGKSRNLPRHEEQQDRDTLYKCEICGAEFAEPEMLKEHKKVHGQRVSKAEERSIGMVEVPVAEPDVD
jgi:hypothetical protein